jgi:23S rRNA (uridine2552-2'-O)-methyltransferase
MANYDKPDFWSLKAQKEGYPARSVYKLKEIDEKFDLLPRKTAQAPGRAEGPGALGAGELFRVLDLGAAPGSWSLFVLRRFVEIGRGFLAAADLSPLSRRYDRGLFDGGNFFFVQGDITDDSVRQTLLSRGPYNLILCDAAPATTGNHSVDALRSLALAEMALEYGEKALARKGSLVLKVFQGGDTAEILTRARKLFASAKGFKPKACRSESVEIYYIGLNRR